MVCLLPLKWNCGHTTYVGTQLDILCGGCRGVVLAPIFVHFIECIDGGPKNHNISSQIKIMTIYIVSNKKIDEIIMWF